MQRIHRVLLFLSLTFPHAAFAGWGAIAFDPATGASAQAHGYPTRHEALHNAMRSCSGSRCRIINWEQNLCIALATNTRGTNDSQGIIWGEGHGFNTLSEAVDAAVSACGVHCAWKECACE